MAAINTPTAWTQLSKAEQLSEWRSFLNHLDAGDAGYHRLYSVLMPLWTRGEFPRGIEACSEVRHRSHPMVAEGDGGWSVRSPVAADELYGLPPF